MLEAGGWRLDAGWSMGCTSQVEVTSQLAAVGIVEQISDGWRILTDQLPYSTDSEAASHYSRMTIARIQRTNLVVLLLYNWRPHDDRSSLGAMLCPQCAGGSRLPSAEAEVCSGTESVYSAVDSVDERIREVVANASSRFVPSSSDVVAEIRQISGSRCPLILPDW